MNGGVTYDPPKLRKEAVLNQHPSNTADEKANQENHDKQMKKRGRRKKRTTREEGGDDIGKSAALDSVA